MTISYKKHIFRQQDKPKVNKWYMHTYIRDARLFGLAAWTNESFHENKTNNLAYNQNI